MTGRPLDAEALATLRKCRSIEKRYPGPESIPLPARPTREDVDRLQARIDARSREATPEGFAIFVENTFEDERGRPIRCAPMHIRWQVLRQEHPRLVLQAANESGKSVQTSIYYVLWVLGHDPNARIALVCNTAARANDLLRVIADHIVHNERLRAIFPHLTPGEPWSSTQLQIAGRTAAAKEPSVSAFGIRGALLGMRLTHVIGDDLLDEENVATLTLQEALIKWWRSTIETRMVSGGRITIIGTPWVPGTDILAVLAKDNSGYFTAKFPAVAPDGRPSWPQVWPAERLTERRKLLGETEFARAMLLNPRIDGQADFREADIKAAVDAGLDFPAASSVEDLPGGAKPEGAEIYFGVDLASGSTKKRRDSTAIAVVMVETEGRHTLLHLSSGRWGLDDTRQRLCDLENAWLPKTIAVESNGMQTAWCTELKKAGLPVVEHVTSSQNKHDGSVGIVGQAALFRNGLYVLPHFVIDSQPGRALLHGLLFYSPGVHTPDEVMATWIAFHVAKADRRAKRAIPTVGVRIIDGSGAKPAPESVVAKPSRLERLFDTPPINDNAEADAREAARNRRHASPWSS